tara:strand:- start:2327 stop:2800 length:474 start_codon:yes stop_codon:yes gene_type:complete
MNVSPEERGYIKGIQDPLELAGRVQEYITTNDLPEDKTNMGVRIVCDLESHPYFGNEISSEYVFEYAGYMCILKRSSLFKWQAYICYDHDPDDIIPDGFPCNLVTDDIGKKFILEYEGIEFVDPKQFIIGYSPDAVYTTYDEIKTGIQSAAEQLFNL